MTFTLALAPFAILCGLVAASPAPQGWDNPDPKEWNSWPQPVPSASPSASSPAATSIIPSASASCQGYFEPLAQPYLNDLAVAAGKLYFGTATDQPGTGEDTDYLYQEILNTTSIFGQVTPANYMKYFATEPEQGVFNYTGGDVVVNIAGDHGKLLRCHNLIWQSQLPDWIVNGTWTAETLTEVMRTHITNLITHWADVCYAWDVVNEALNSNGTFSQSIWYDVIGPEYFPLAFQFAQEAVEATGKDIKLYYNDYGIESMNNKSARTRELVSELQGRGIRIDGIGLESHFTVGQSPSYEDSVETMTAYTDLGVEVAVTELDVRFDDASTARTNTSGLAMQAQGYYDSVRACVDAEGCIGITVWDFADTYSWIPQTFEGEGAADLYWEDYRRKPAYYAVGEALQGVACTNCG